ncbi:hypothetical protein BC332_27400 [Capsicum chinense]|nr:hypothetical protein BC332_27400 [Capsicum chinense]
MQSGDLDCVPDDVVISYLMNSRKKVNPTIINSNVCVLMYMMDVDTDGFRPILRINIAERSFEGLVNSLEPPPLRPTVDDDFSDYENDGNHPINTEDDSMLMEDKLKSIVEDKLDLCVISDRHVYTDDEFSEHFAELKNNSPEEANVLENVLDFEKWSRAHFPGNRYDVMTTNIVESLNSVLMDEQEYPVSDIFNSIARKFGEKFRKRHAFVAGQNNKFFPCSERIVRGNKSASDSLYVTNANGGLDQFTVFGSDVTTKVNLLKRSVTPLFLPHPTPLGKLVLEKMDFSN